MTLADLNGDGYCDATGTSNNMGDVAWWQNMDGTGTSWGYHNLATDMVQPRTALAADFDSDGQDEPMAAGTQNSLLWILAGSVVSSILDAGAPSEWGTISWSEYLPAGTNIGFRVRASETPAMPTDWSPTIWSPSSLEEVLPAGSRYMQYMLCMYSPSELSSPLLIDVQVTWDPVGIEPGEQGGISLDPVSPNPAHGIAYLSFTLPVPGTVAFAVFDSSGRLVYSRGPQEYSQGGSTVGIGDLPPGVYSVVMESGDSRTSRRFVMIE